MAVYDCIMVYNEIDLLKVRLRILNSVVDYFVIVEIGKTFRGEDKPYYFLDRENEFYQFRNKIIYVNGDYVPQCKGNGDWSIEAYQRNCMIKALEKCKPEDLILISDVDEIPNPDIIKNQKDYFVNCKNINTNSYNKKGLLLAITEFPKTRILDLILGKVTVYDAVQTSPIVFNLINHYYFMNCRGNGLIACTIMCKFKNMQLPQVLREKRTKLLSVDKSGWHFSYLGGLEFIKNKLKSIIDDRPDIIKKMKECSTDDEYITECITHGIDLYGRKDSSNVFNFIKLEDVGITDISTIARCYPQFFFKP